jgi:CRISPR-associated endonuclease/helicase Cas3
VLDVPTGLGKTAAVTLAWLYRRRVRGETDLPRRLVWCLPMRVLVEQTVTNAIGWLDNLDLRGKAGDSDRVAVHTLMGGEPDLARASWAAHPEQDAILVGTQDMLLSRALMRGYGMSRYQWPVHFALLHNDALWVFDEVQLMGPALATTAQLEAFRRAREQAAPARSLWVSATLRADWLDTVDFRSHRAAGLSRAGLQAADREEPSVAARIEAPKTLERASVRFDDASRKGHERYVTALAEAVRAAHVPGEQTLVICNQVERAQGVFDQLAGGEAERLLLHARFRRAERNDIEARLSATPGERGRIVVATQAIEAGVDLDSRVLFTELAPWASLVQRFGRCNRVGRYGGEHTATVYWIDLDEQAKGVALPYEAESLAAARARLERVASAAPLDLPPVEEPPPAGQVLRRRDFDDLFNTDPDLSGFDVDISPYIRDTGTPPVQVFWRDLDLVDPGEQAAPARDELCPVSIAQLRAHLTSKLSPARRKACGRDNPGAWCLDPLAGDDRDGRWRPVRADDVRPGQTILLAAADGGYDSGRGFVAGATAPVAVVTEEEAPSPEGYASDTMAVIGRRVALARHLADVESAAVGLADALGVSRSESEMLSTAARWHDVGKAHEAFQRGIGFEPDDPEGPWAKSERGGRPHYCTVDADGTELPRPGFRHELASALAWLEAGGTADTDAQWHDLVAYLIAAHHGRVRLGLRALPGEQPPNESDRLYARGVLAGDRLPAVDLGDRRLEPITLRLDVMRLGRGPQGPSWTERTQGLVARLGPFRLAWLEALLRIADWRASAQEDQR